MRTRLSPNPIRRSQLVAGAVPVLLVLGLSFVVWFGTEVGAVASKDRPGEVRMSVNHTVLTEDDAEAADSAEAPLDVEQIPAGAGDASASQKAASQTSGQKGAGKKDAEQTADAGKPAAKADTAAKAEKAQKTTAKESPGPSLGTITDIRMVEQGAKTGQAAGVNLLAVLSQKPERTTWFYLPDTGRLIIDIHGRRTTVGPPVYRFDSGPVQHVVIGEHPDRLRLAVVFRTPLPSSVKPELKPVADGLNIFLPAS